MGKFIDLTGKKFEKLTVLRRDESVKPGNGVYWICLCECGNECSISSYALNKKIRVDCGKHRSEHHFIKHGDTKRNNINRLYRIHNNMIQRCDNPQHSDYQWYGGKGIKVCEAWYDYETFKTWALNNGYNDNLTIDRIDGDGNYCPENCRWATMTIQANNKKSVPKYEYNGEMHSISEWARILGVKRELLRDRINRLGWSVDEAFSTPPSPINQYFEYNGESHTWKEWSDITGINENTLRGRYNDAHWSIEKTLSTPLVIDRSKNN